MASGARRGGEEEEGEAGRDEETAWNDRDSWIESGRREGLGDWGLRIAGRIGFGS